MENSNQVIDYSLIEGCLSKAPSFFILLSVVFSLFFSESLPVHYAIIVSLFISTSAVLLLTRRVVKNFFPILFIVIALSGLSSYYVLVKINDTYSPSGEISGECAVTYSHRWGNGCALMLDTEYGRAVAYIAQSKMIHDGSRVRFSGVFVNFSRAKNDGEFDEYNYWRARGAIKKIALYKLHVTAPPKGIGAWREKLGNAIYKRLLPLSASYLAAFTVGRRDKGEEELHRKAGTSHLLAVSGLHINILTAMLLVFMPVNFLSLMIISVILWLYLLFAGMPVGGVRAAVMSELLLISIVSGRENCVLNTVSVAGVVMLLINPWNYYDLGWRMSVISAAFLASVFSFRHYFSCAVKIVLFPVLLWFVNAPIVAKAFGEVPLAGLILNIFAVPLFSFIFPIILLFTLPAVFNIPGLRLLSLFPEFILSYFDSFLEKGAYLVPGIIMWNILLFANAAFIFAAAAAMHCNAGVKRSFLAGLLSFCAAAFLAYL